MMRVVAQGCVALLPVVVSTVLLQPAPVTGLRYPQPPDTRPQQLRQYLHEVPPDDHPTPSWHKNGNLQQYHLGGLPDDPKALPRDFPLQQYLQGIQQDAPSVLQDGGTIQQYPRTTYHEPGSWWHPAVPHPALPTDPHAQHNTHRAQDDTNDAHHNSLHLYDDEDDDDVHPNSIAAHREAGEAAHHDVGDTHRNLREGEAAGEEEGDVMAYPALPCWHYLPPEPTWCPSILFQVLGHQLARASRPPPTWRSPPTTRGVVPPAFHWFRKPPSKRYLGIELPDYIATSYSSIKTDNAHYLTKLHQLKQRMRNAGK